LEQRHFKCNVAFQRNAGGFSFGPTIAGSLAQIVGQAKNSGINPIDPVKKV
jgi:hypothetical protein